VTASHRVPPLPETVGSGQLHDRVPPRPTALLGRGRKRSWEAVEETVSNHRPSSIRDAVKTTETRSA
jgi:hypothetical protein